MGAVNAIATIGMLADANAPSSQRSGEHYHVAGLPFARSTLRAVRLGGCLISRRGRRLKIRNTILLKTNLAERTQIR